MHRRGSSYRWVLVVLLGCGLMVQPALAQQELLIVHGDEDYPPMEMRVEGRLTGFHVELVNAVADRLEIKVTWKSLPWKRALFLVESGAADGITYISRTPEREAWALFLEDNVLSIGETTFLILKDNASRIAFDGDVASFVRGRTLLAIRGFQFGHEALDRATKFETGNMTQLVTMLRARRYEVAVVNWHDFQGAFQGKPELDDIQPLRPPILETKNYLAFSKARPLEPVARRFADELKAFRRTPEYRSLRQRYRLGP